MHKYLEEKEDKIFSKEILRINHITDFEEKTKEIEKIKDKVGLLVYLICNEKLYLPKDEASEIYLSCIQAIDKIVSGYKITINGFNAYLSEVCRYRYRRIVQKRSIERTYESSYIEEGFPIELHEGLPLEYEYSAETEKTIENDIKLMNMRQTFDYIVNNQNRLDYPIKNKKEMILSSKLKNKSMRRRLLFYILHLPPHSSYDEVENYARAFKTDEEAFLHLLDMKRDKIAKRIEKKEKEYSIAVKHWKIMASLLRTLENEGDPAIRSVIIENYHRQARLHASALKKASKSLCGMTTRDIEEELGIGRCYASQQIAYIKRILMEISEEKEK